MKDKRRHAIQKAKRYNIDDPKMVVDAFIHAYCEEGKKGREDTALDIAVKYAITNRKARRIFDHYEETDRAPVLERPLNVSSYIEIRLDRGLIDKSYPALHVSEDVFNGNRILVMCKQSIPIDVDVSKNVSTRLHDLLIKLISEANDVDELKWIMGDRGSGNGAALRKEIDKYIDKYIDEYIEKDKKRFLGMARKDVISEIRVVSY